MKYTIKQVASMLGKSQQSIRIGIQNGSLPFGHAIKTSDRFTYVIYEKKLKEFIDLDVIE